MIEFLRHSLGLCGEPHPSLLTLLLGAPAVSYIIYKIKSKNKWKYLRNQVEEGRCPSIGGGVLKHINVYLTKHHY